MATETTLANEVKRILVKEGLKAVNSIDMKDPTTDPLYRQIIMNKVMKTQDFRKEEETEEIDPCAFRAMRILHMELEEMLRTTSDVDLKRLVTEINIFECSTTSYWEVVKKYAPAESSTIRNYKKLIELRDMCVKLSEVI